MIMSVWKEVGFFMVVFLAGLQNIPSDYYEAAQGRRLDRLAGVPIHHACRF